MSPADLKKVPNSILVSGGLYKADIIRAILVSGYVNNLVTDETVAQRLLQRA
jgi:DNA-binding transcriptional regulator LsrR (DeoR family)